MRTEKNNCSVTVSAPGKLMLLGEHAVVYGFPCLVTAVDTRIRVTAQIINGKTDILVAPQVKECKFVKKALEFFKEKYKLTKAVKIQTQSDFSHQVGLGSSSAVTVATLKALTFLFGEKLSKKEIFDLSYKVTLAIQKVGSGFDIAAATYGGVLYFISGGKVIRSIKINFPSLIIGYSGIKADTPSLIKKVGAFYKAKKRKTENIFKKIAHLVEKGEKLLIKKDYKNFGFLMNQNHTLLQKLGVSTPKLDRLVAAALQKGAYGAKLSGAGGGDCMIAVCPQENAERVKDAVRKAGGEIINVKPNALGVRFE